MLGIAKIADAGPVNAALIAAGLFVFGLALQLKIPAASLLSLLAYVFSTAVVCFVVLRRGESAIVQVVLLALLVLFAVSLALKTGLQLPISAFVFWLAGVVVAVVLRRTVDLSIATLAAMVCGIVAFVGVSMFAPNLSEQWQLVVSSSLENMPAQDRARFTEEQLNKMIEGFSSMLPAALSLSVMLVALCSVYIARWWQASIANPGGFQKEFHQLRYGRVIAIAGLVLIGIAVSVGGPNGIALAALIIFAFFIQGLSVVHSLVKQRGMNQGWLIGIYLLLLIPHTVLLLGALGLSDNLYSLRKSPE
jgi:hypothetical protein